MTPEQSIQLFSIMFYVFLGIMALGFGLAIFFFFHYKIPSVYSLMTGSARRRKVEQMQKSGQLRSEADIEAEREYVTSGNLALGMTGDYRTEPLTGATGRVEVLSATPVYEAAQETTILAPEAETVVLEPEQETTVLESETETTVLEPATETVTYDEGRYTTLQEAEGMVSPGKYERMQASVSEKTEDIKGLSPYEEASTTLLDDKHQRFFESTEHTMVIHTNEEL